jgi:hypothetical protein
MRTATCVVAALGSLLYGPLSGAGPAKLPAVVAADLRDIAGECTGVGGKADTSQAVKRVDLNGDGKEDYVLDVGSIHCDGAASIYGDRAKGVTVYAGDGAGGAQQAFSAMAYSVSLEGTGPLAKLWLTVSGQTCGKKPAQDFASEAFCDRYLVWNAKVQKFDFAPVSTVRMIQ